MNELVFFVMMMILGAVITGYSFAAMVVILFFKIKTGRKFTLNTMFCGIATFLFSAIGFVVWGQ